MKGSLVTVALVTGVLAIGQAALADCTTVSGNELTPNCGFDSGDPPTGWTAAYGALTRNTTVVHGGAGSGEIDAEIIKPPQEVAAVVSSCFPITASSGYGFGGFFRPASGSASLVCRAVLYGYQDAGCALAGTVSVSPFVSATTGDWVLTTATADTTGDTHATLRLACFATDFPANFVVLVDDAFAGPGLGPFADGFESGGTGAWSATFPP